MFNWFKIQRQKDEEWVKDKPTEPEPEIVDVLEPTEEHIMGVLNLNPEVPFPRQYLNFFRDQCGLPHILKGQIITINIGKQFYIDQCFKYVAKKGWITYE